MPSVTPKPVKTSDYAKEELTHALKIYNHVDYLGGK
jgi:hypothetical protein